MTPSIQLQVLQKDYPLALATDGERWADQRSARPAWKGTSAFRLQKDVEDRSYWRIFAMCGEREYQLRHAAACALVAGAIAGCSFRSCDAMAAVACERIVETFDRALSGDEHDHILEAAREIWEVATPSTVETFDLTNLGREVLRASELAS